MEKLNQSKTRVVLMASDGVVLAVEAFWSEHGTLSSSRSHAAFSKIINAMRADLNGQSSVALDVLQRSLFGGSNA
ncbi:hypothetical protein VV869_19010 [Photobacterium sp. MCCC 1A19761]|uniref:hypothetical protein n=1 Tax=Photobacterium sp. MCCC 1A19761 TaxID=3115000 RepID=UPI00307CDF42